MVIRYGTGQDFVAVIRMGHWFVLGVVSFGKSTCDKRGDTSWGIDRLPMIRVQLENPPCFPFMQKFPASDAASNSDREDSSLATLATIDIPN